MLQSKTYSLTMPLSSFWQIFLVLLQFTFWLQELRTTLHSLYADMHQPRAPSSRYPIFLFDQVLTLFHTLWFRYSLVWISQRLIKALWTWPLQINGIKLHLLSKLKNSIFSISDFVEYIVKIYTTQKNRKEKSGRSHQIKKSLRGGSKHLKIIKSILQFCCWRKM